LLYAHIKKNWLLSPIVVSSTMDPMKFKIKNTASRVLDYHFYPETKSLLVTFIKMQGKVKDCLLLLKGRSTKESSFLI